METNLRPLTLGEILDRTAQLYRSHFWLFAGIASVNSGAVLLLNLLEIGAQEALRAEHLTRYLVLLVAGAGMLQLLISFLVGGIAAAANNRAVAWLHLGEPATIRGAYSSILPRTGRYAWLMIIITFVIWTPMALLYGGGLAWILVSRPAARAAMQHVANSAAANQRFALMAGALFLIGVVFLVYAIFMFLRYSLAIAASVVEDLKAREAIRRSVELSQGARGRIFLLLVLVLIIYLGLFGLAQMVFIVMALHHGELPVGARIAQQLVAFVTDTFIGPIYATGLTLFYYDQRVRKEGYDIEWMMQAAGLIAPAAEVASAGGTEPSPAAAQTGPAEPA
ncbi:MAG TPA: hypothetical protein VGL00_14720 [Terracidiphilus sp.]|jgi:uncharacterized membrane protein